MGTKKFWSQLTGATGPSKQKSDSKTNQNTEPVRSKSQQTNQKQVGAKLGPINRAGCQITPIKAPVSPTTKMAQLQLSKTKKSRKSKLISSKSFRPLVNLNLQLATAVRERVMKARQDGQAFIRLTNELATPPAKLYSPFNILDTPENRLESTRRDTRARRKLENSLSPTSLGTRSSLADRTDLSLDKLSKNDSSGFIDCSFETESKSTTPKERIALQHKKHLMQANKFAFDSPTGKLRETVKDVEHFQECIEAISKAIESRRSN